MSFRGGFRGRGRGGGYYKKSDQNAGASSKPHVSSKYTKLPAKSANPLNQYYLDRFIKLKRDADLRGMQNLSQSYKRVINCLGKYPMPIFSAMQTKYLEGVGEMIAVKFDEMVTQRGKEYEDALFEIELLRNQNGKKFKLSEERRVIAGVRVDEEEIEELGSMSLKEFLKNRDQKWFREKNGLGEIGNTKKRKYDEIGEGGEDVGGGKKLGGQRGTQFLDVGSVSWSLLLGCYFLQLHDERKTFYITIESIREMLTVLKQEFKDFIPFENDPQLLDRTQSDELVKLKDNAFIDLIESTIPKDPDEWKFLMTDKGLKRAKCLCRSIGILVSVEIDIEKPTTNKITINLYDKDLMPIVDELYQQQDVSKIKDEDDSGGIFDEFIGSIEREIDGILMQHGASSHKKSDYSKQLQKTEQLTMEIFNNNNIQGAQMQDEEEDENVVMGDDELGIAKELMNMAMDSNSVNEIQAPTNQQFVKNENPSNPKHQMMQQLAKCIVPFEQQVDCEVILYVDNREKKNQQQGNYIYNKLLDTKINCEQKALPLGDFIWILRVRQNILQGKEECIEDESVQTKAKGKRATKKKVPPPREYIDYVLDFIVERKTADDLAASIVDGRYEEQKFRLKNCGINNVVYLIEGKAGQYTKIPPQVLSKAQIHTQIFHNFNVLRLTSIQETLKWLTDMTRDIIEKIKVLRETQPNFQSSIADNLIDFKHFAQESGKNSNLNVQQIFARQLRTCKGLGIENVSTITRVFKTPNILYRCYKQCKDDKHASNLLNAGKMELLRNELILKHGVNSKELIPIQEGGQPSVPRNVDDSDMVDLQNIILGSSVKLFPKLLRNLESVSGGVKMRKINKRQCQLLYELLASGDYSKCKGDSGV